MFEQKKHYLFTSSIMHYLNNRIYHNFMKKDSLTTFGDELLHELSNIESIGLINIQIIYFKGVKK